MKIDGTMILFLQCHGRKRNTVSQARRTQAPTIQHSFYLPAVPSKVDITREPWNSERLKKNGPGSQGCSSVVRMLSQHAQSPSCSFFGSLASTTYSIVACLESQEEEAGGPEIQYHSLIAHLRLAWDV